MPQKFLRVSKLLNIHIVTYKRFVLYYLLWNHIYINYYFIFVMSGHLTNIVVQVFKDMDNYRYDHICIKSDGSLDDVFEIVSHLMTLDYHQNEIDW